MTYIKGTTVSTMKSSLNPLESSFVPSSNQMDEICLFIATRAVVAVKVKEESFFP